jgi:hypothetical protein
MGAANQLLGVLLIASPELLPLTAAAVGVFKRGSRPLRRWLVLVSDEVDATHDVVAFYIDNGGAVGLGLLLAPDALDAAWWNESEGVVLNIAIAGVTICLSPAVEP